MMEDVFNVFEEILSDDEVDDMANIVEMPRQPRIFRQRPVHFEIWNEQEFLNRFRLRKETTLGLLNEIEPVISHRTNWNYAIGPLMQLLITLRYYASGDMLIALGDFGGVHKCTAGRIVHSVSRAIASLSRRYINFPQTDNDIIEAKHNFFNISRFPKVLGAIDCTHIKIQSPGQENGEIYRNRKGFFSVNVQTVSDASLRIINIVARWPGATHDSTIFNNSRLKAEFEEGRFGDSFLLGDSGYALKDYLMTPVLNPTTRAERRYNFSHIRTRNVVERQYGIWKRRFPILSTGIKLKLENALIVIAATAVLHNIAISRNDQVPEDELNVDLEEHDEEPYQGNIQGNIRRQTLIQEYFSNLQH